MKNIPTAEEFLKDSLTNPTKGWAERKRLIEFAKLHVEAALKEVIENVKWKEQITMQGLQVTINKSSILNAYPLTNIK